MLYLDRFETILELKRYSNNTIDTYLGMLNVFINHLGIEQIKLADLEDRDLVATIISITKYKQYGISSQKQLIGAINLFYREVFKRKIDFSSIYPTRTSQYLPQVLSKEEVKEILNANTNLKHKAILATIYGLGLRVGELIDLKINNIDSDRMLVHIQNAKGKKDRVVMLPSYLLDLLRLYFKEYTPKMYLFEGQSKQQYSASSIRKILKRSVNEVHISKPVTVHTLRHSFATHLLENGTDIRIIQKLLGHKDIKTTLQYTQVAKSTIQNIKSPLDTL